MQLCLKMKLHFVVLVCLLTLSLVSGKPSGLPPCLRCLEHFPLCMQCLDECSPYLGSTTAKCLPCLSRISIGHRNQDCTSVCYEPCRVAGSTTTATATPPTPTPTPSHKEGAEIYNPARLDEEDSQTNWLSGSRGWEEMDAYRRLFGTGHNRWENEEEESMSMSDSRELSTFSWEDMEEAIARIQPQTPKNEHTSTGQRERELTPRWHRTKEGGWEATPRWHHFGKTKEGGWEVTPRHNFEKLTKEGNTPRWHRLGKMKEGATPRHNSDKTNEGHTPRWHHFGKTKEGGWEATPRHSFEKTMEGHTTRWHHFGMTKEGGWEATPRHNFEKTKEGLTPRWHSLGKTKEVGWELTPRAHNLEKTRSREDNWEVSPSSTGERSWEEEIEELLQAEVGRDEREMTPHDQGWLHHRENGRIVNCHLYGEVGQLDMDPRCRNCLGGNSKCMRCSTDCLFNQNMDMCRTCLYREGCSMCARDCVEHAFTHTRLGGERGGKEWGHHQPRKPHHLPSGEQEVGCYSSPQCERESYRGDVARARECCTLSRTPGHYMYMEREVMGMKSCYRIMC